jgi:hypothetical protein
MRCTLSTPTFDLDGFVELQLSSPAEPSETRRRVNRIATLDGGAVLNDFGFTDADRTLLLSWQPTGRQEHLDIERLVQTYAQLQVAITSGVYLAAPEVYQQGDDESTLRLLVIRKLSA